MTDVLFAIRAGDRLFTLDKLTLGDFSMFKREFGIKAEDIFVEALDDQGEAAQKINLGDFDVLIALLVAVLRRERPTAAVSVLRAEIEALDIAEIAIPDADTEDEEADPTPGPAVAEGTDDHEKVGSSGKRQKKPGRQS